MSSNNTCDTKSAISFSSSSSLTDSIEYVAALIGLGYNQKTADKIIRSLLEENPTLTIEDLIKESLKNLNK